MRILLVNQFGHRIGGIEVYLRHLAPALVDRGHEVALLHQEPIPSGGEPLIAQSSMPRWCLRESGLDDTLRGVRKWRPDLVYAHQLIEDTAIAALQSNWSSIYFAHCYVGVCISGGKCWKRPVPRICQRRLGWGCLVHYLPHGCGGLNPIVMWRLYRDQLRAQGQLRRFHKIVTHSEYVRQEYLRHGFPEEYICKIPFWVPGKPRQPVPQRRILPDEASRLVFLGRCEIVKGGTFLLDALPLVSKGLGRPVELILGGEGPELEAWKAHAAGLMKRHPGIRVSFPGWLSPAARSAALDQAHVAVVPSLWPEPFGMTGIEAGFHAVPTVAFDVGGITEWLSEGINGHLAPGTPTTPPGLAQALIRTLSKPDHYERLCAGALLATERFTADVHLRALDGLFANAAQGFREPQ